MAFSTGRRWVGRKVGLSSGTPSVPKADEGARHTQEAPRLADILDPKGSAGSASLSPGPWEHRCMWGPSSSHRPEGGGGQEKPQAPLTRMDPDSSSLAPIRGQVSFPTTCLRSDVTQAPNRTQKQHSGSPPPPAGSAMDGLILGTNLGLSLPVVLLSGPNVDCTAYPP